MYLFSCFTLCASCSSSCFFFFYSYGDHRDLHSFPTRRSSDLETRDIAAAIKARFPNLITPAKDDICYATQNRSRCRLWPVDRKSTRLNSSHPSISYAVFCLKKKKKGN